MAELDGTKNWVLRLDDDITPDQVQAVIIKAVRNWTQIPVVMKQGDQRIRCILGDLSNKLPKEITMWDSGSKHGDVLVHRILDTLARSETLERRVSSGQLQTLRNFSGVPSQADFRLISDHRPVKGITVELDLDKMKAIQKELNSSKDWRR